jgi:hypothetical protein
VPSGVWNFAGWLDLVLHAFQGSHGMVRRNLQSKQNPAFDNCGACFPKKREAGSCMPALSASSGDAPPGFVPPAILLWRSAAACNQPQRVNMRQTRCHADVLRRVGKTDLQFMMKIAVAPQLPIASRENLPYTAARLFK